ncbi:hypothetical protein LTR37_016438 [Vermiconidia calcicola]|uniref:Uncharacterized protein n=1 Tax=Vermiconidia calcicola TaxID=1690605 RepID=A0ACC3MMU7_9PEZI|nr:hypothetical protein LTR37_016438 [Vermiconidia calcicola]
MASSRNIPSDDDAYNNYTERMREVEYPMLKDSIYLDHAGTTLFSKTLMERFHAEMMANLYGNPHSASPSSQKSTQTIEDARLRLLRFFNADPDHFDLIFTANATAAIKLVGHAFREKHNSFSYRYHVDSHTSVVGVRELAHNYSCLDSDGAVEKWINRLDVEEHTERSTLFAYPAQSNMDGRRLPLHWCRSVQASASRAYTLLDAAAYASTSPLDLGNVDAAPDFSALSLYKIFGFPDLGALIVKKSAAHVFEQRRYFGGGTVDLVVCLKEQWHASKSGPLHERLEDGTLPIHSILALEPALQTHEELFGTLERISEHTAKLASELYERLLSLKHGSGRPVCAIYKYENSSYGDRSTQGPIVAFNLQDGKGEWVSNAEVEKLASIKNIHLRTGGVCNPGGVATALKLAPWEMKENFSAGHRCGSENDIMNGKPTGVIRVSLGAMSTRSDVDRFLSFVDEFFVDKSQTLGSSMTSLADRGEQPFHVESLTVYPIKSCGGWRIPHDRQWEIRPEGLAWDREWCIVHQGTGKALSQKHYPRMALIRPCLDFEAGTLRVHLAGSSGQISVPLSKNPALYGSSLRARHTSVCGDPLRTFMYASAAMTDFFTKAVGVPCTLARFDPASTSSRHSKLHLLPHSQSQTRGASRPILLSNESPILTISRSSLNRLNEQIKTKGGKAAHPSVFRANIVLAENRMLSPRQEQPWAEDKWHSMRIGGEEGTLFDILGGCRRCQMVCVDQENSEKNSEPFVTLAKTRRFDGRVLFGVHTALAKTGGKRSTITVGDVVDTFRQQEVIE